MNDYERYKMYSNNCAKLADVLREVPNEQHNQRGWARKDHSCGTVGCAMGWAAMSEQFEGLGISEMKDVPASYALIPTLDGEESNWGTAAKKYFGMEVYNHVFLGLGDKDQVIAKLMYWAETYCARAKDAKQ